MVCTKYIALLTIKFIFLGTLANAQSTGIFLVVKKVTEKIVPKKDTVLVQTVRGQIIDNETKHHLTTATVILQLDSVRYMGTSSNESGNFRFENVRTGRYVVKVSHVGYKPTETSILINSAKETALEIPMIEAAGELDTIEIKAPREVDTPVGSQIINTLDLIKFPGWDESIRKVSALPGIQNPTDSRNDVVIRGNSPGSVLWRLEGINIPNPNHFNIPGTAGGPVSMINDKMLANSAFYSGAFPAEFGNTTSGIFDLRFRKGDSIGYNSSLQIGVLGAEVSSEGPLFSKRGPTYLFSFRRSTMGFFQKMGLDIGTNAIPTYTDASVNLNFPITNKSSLSVFGLAGVSTIDILISKDTNNIYGERDRDQYFRTKTGVAGISYENTINKSTFLSTTLAVSSERIRSYHDLVYPRELREEIIAFDNQNSADTLPLILRYNFKESRISYAFHFTKKLRAVGSSLHVGFISDYYFLNYLDSVRITSGDDFGKWRTRWMSTSNSWLVQPYVQWKYQAPNFEFSAGLHSQYFSFSGSYLPAEPRLGFKYYIKDTQTITMGFGMHSQIQSPYLYFYRGSNESTGSEMSNNKMDFTRSIHSVLGYELLIGPDKRPVSVKAEIYYQYLYNIPVDRDVASSFSLLNTGATFTRFYPNALANKGRGENYGIEATAYRSFSKGYLFLITGSLFQSKYRASDFIWRNTDFNVIYIFNLLFTREWILKKQNVISLGSRISTMGGRRYGPVDAEASEQQKDVVFIDSSRNTLRFNPYFKADVSVSYKINLEGVSHEFAIDLINVFNTRNVLRLTYVPDYKQQNKGRVEKEYQLGFLPFFYYRFIF